MDDIELIMNAMLDDVGWSSDSDDEDFHNLVENLNFDNHAERRRIPRCQNYIEEVIDLYDDDQFRDTFRVTRATFNYLVDLLNPLLQVDDGIPGRRTISSQKQLLVALCYFGTPDSYKSIIDKLDVGISTAWRAVFRVVRALIHFHSHFIHWPTMEEALNTAINLEVRYGFPGVVGAVDGTHIPITAPRENAQNYVNRKGWHSIQLQVVCNEKLQFIHTFCGPVGSTHDARVFKFSGLQAKLTNQNFPPDMHLLGDSAYQLQKHVMVPFKDNGHLTVEETFYNTKLSSTRMIVERAIGLLKNRWRILLDKLPMNRTDLIPFYVEACCILHNICLIQADEIEFLFEIPELEYNELELLAATEQEKNEGRDKRERLKYIISA